MILSILLIHDWIRRVENVKNLEKRKRKKEKK